MLLITLQKEYLKNNIKILIIIYSIFNNMLFEYIQTKIINVFFF